MEKNLEEVVEKEVEEKGTVIHNYIQQENKSNSLGTAGFVLAIIGFFLGWIPFIGTIIWLLGAIFSIIGIFKKPNGLAIAGTVISFIGFILLFALFGIASLG